MRHPRGERERLPSLEAQWSCRTQTPDGCAAAGTGPGELTPDRAAWTADLTYIWTDEGGSLHDWISVQHELNSAAEYHPLEDGKQWEAHGMSRKSLTILLIFPVALIVVGWTFLLQISPFYAGAYGYDQDPAYVYLFSGLTLLDGHSPTHIDHPGTPLQILCALVVFLRWFVIRITEAASTDIVSAVSLQPEPYIFTISCALLILNAWATYFFGRRIFQSIGSIKVALFCQSAPLAFWIVAPRVTYLSPEALLIFASLCLLGLLAPLVLGVRESQNYVSDRIPPLAGIVLGFGVALKITFIPMVGLLLLLDSRSDRIRAIKYAAIAWAICILPILNIKKMESMIGWIYSLMVHSGNYGSGGTDVVNVKALYDRMDNLFETFPFFFYVNLILLAVLIVKAAAKNIYMVAAPPAAMSHDKVHKKMRIDARALNINGSTKVPLVLALVGIIQTLLVLKHPGAHYIIPVLPIAFMGAAWLAQSDSLGLSVRYIEWLRIILLGSACIMAINATSFAFNNLRESRLIQDKSLASIQAELKKYPNPLVIGAYRCSLPECALSFGASYAPVLEKKVAPVLENFYEFNIWNKKLRVFGEGWVSLQRINKYIAEGRSILLVSPMYPELGVFALEPIVHSPVQSLYRITGVADTGS